MSQSVRQSELFAGQDWHVLYRAFTQINFNASDPNSINKALREYIQANYPEDFSDWIESSEFVAIMDLLSYLAGTLAFKTDINARENFLEVAEARESVLRLARFLSYNPRRCQTSRGLLKLQTIQTNDDVYDALGTNLANRTLSWNDPNDADWFEHIVLVLNNAFVTTHPFGIPLKAGSLSGTKTQLYRVNARMGDIVPSFKATVDGDSLNFEVINMDFDETSGFTERTPDPDAAFHLAYRSDGNGNMSANTGFFIGFKQGEMRNQLFSIPNQIENLVIDISDTNVNQTDVWVQTLSDTNAILTNWTQVPVMLSDNVTGYNTTYNAVPVTVRDIYTVVTRDNDAISLRFSDGRFGTVPVGNLKVWYRTSTGTQYQITPQDMSSVNFTLTYLNKRGVAKTLTMTFSLEESVSNSAERETEDEIRRRAPQVYATQNRMVSGEDYNTFPLASNNAKKIKAVSRVYSGHSRFIDLNDPTGTYQNTVVFGDDGMLYAEEAVSYAEVPITDNRTADELISLYIQPLVARTDMVNYVQDRYLRFIHDEQVPVPEGMTWHQSTTTTGYFNLDSPYIRAGASVLFSINGMNTWVNVVSVSASLDIVTPPVGGESGPVTLSETVPSTSAVVAIMPYYGSTLTEDVLPAIRQKLQNTLSFNLYYDFNDGDTPWSVYAPNTVPTSDTALQLFTAQYLSGDLWRFTARGMRYVFESLKQVRFYFDGQLTSDTNNLVSQDLVRVLKINAAADEAASLGRDYDLAITKMLVAPDGWADPKRIAVRFIDSNLDGAADNPDTYRQIISSDVPNTFLFWARQTDGTWMPTYDIVAFAEQIDREHATDLPEGTVAFQINGEQPNSFWLMGASGWTAVPFSYRYARGRGPNVATRFVGSDGKDRPKPLGSVLYFEWKHYAPTTRRIDPAKSNIIDIFVLTTEYDYLVRQWIANGALASSAPMPPSEFQLRTTFNEFETYKMFSDDIVWRPVRYKYLFGSNADQALRAQFKVVKLPTAAISDGEIKSRIIKAVDNYFSTDYWDFGETFYFTEMAAYIHQQLAGIVASVVIVPLSQTGVFGDGFEVKCRSDELFISTAQVTDILIIDSNTAYNLRIA